MLVPKPQSSIAIGASGELRLNGKRVGTVRVSGSSASWSWGYFDAEPPFTEFAPLFGMWSLLMHVDGSDARLSRAASEELREAELKIDALKGEFYWPADQKTTRAWQVNIDGNLVEWKHE